MIGNDIVDLIQAKRESNWRRKGFLDKLFTEYEQQLIHTASDPDQMVWLLWSMKESTYKMAVRDTGIRIFAPKKIACFINETTPNDNNGTVFFCKEYQTKSSITDKYIATVAFSINNTTSYTQVIVPFENTTYQTHHWVIRKHIKQQCAAILSIPKKSIRIHKNNTGIPLLIVNNSLEIPLTISHHGHFGAFVIAA